MARQSPFQSSRMMFRTLVLVAASASLSFAQTSPLALCLSAATSTSSFGGSSQFANDLSTMFNQDALGSTQPVAFTFPSSENEVAAIVKCAVHYHTPIVPRCGGHSYEALSAIDKGVVVDVGNFLDVEVDATSKTAVVGAGNWLGRLYSLLDSQGGFVLPGGDCPHVGVAGHTLGGGFGLLSRQLGIMLDALVEVRLVDATGQIRVVNAQTDPDLFWALRGAGASNFGIITSFKFNIFQGPSKLVYNYYQWDSSARKQVLAAFISDSANLPNDITGTIYTDNSGNSVGMSLVRWNKDFSDGAVDAMLKKMPTVTPSTTTYSSYLDLIVALWSKWTKDDLMEKSKLVETDKFKTTSFFTNGALSDAGMTTLVDQSLLSVGGYTASLQLDNWGGAISSSPPNSTSFIHRGAFVGFQASVETVNSNAKSAIETWRQSLQSYVVEAYQNYIDLEVPMEAYYGTKNLPVLQSIKARVDPSNVWAHPGGLTPAGGAKPPATETSSSAEAAGSASIVPPTTSQSRGSQSTTGAGSSNAMTPSSLSLIAASLLAVLAF